MMQPKEKQLQIYNAVLALASRGVDLNAVRMQEIASEAGIGKGTIYEYFPSKEAVLSATVTYCIDSEIRYLNPTITACHHYSDLCDVLIQYTAELVTQRFASYDMIGQVLGSNTGCAISVPHLEEAATAFRNLCDYAFSLTLSDGLVQPEDRDYFQHLLLSNLLGYSSSLLRHIKRETLTPDTLNVIQEQARRLFIAGLK